MNAISEKFLFKLLNTPSPSGYETPASKIWRAYVKDHCDALEHDVHGNSYAILNPKAKFTVMLAGHIDEIGLIVQHIDEQGYLYVGQIGGMDPALLVGQRVQIQTVAGPVLGVIGRKAIHNMSPEDRQKAVTMDNIWVDIGAADKKAAEKIVAIGDPMVVDVQAHTLRDDKVISRATDDKVGAYLVAEIIKSLSRKKLNIKVVGVATVQEEVGLRGATTSAYNTNADAGIAFDVNFATDHPETDKKKLGDVKLGGGPNLHRGPNFNPLLYKQLVATAKKLKMPIQICADGRPPGTDANTMQLSRGGMAAALISIPNRYMHTPVEVVSKTDLDHIVKLVSTFLASHPTRRDYRP